MITFEQIKQNGWVAELIETGNRSLGVMGFTEHGTAHVARTAAVAGDILEKLGYDARTQELARIAGYLHDIGNAVNRVNHAQSGALLAYRLLEQMGMDAAETVAIVNAIGNHDDGMANAVSPLSAALILADKSDVRRTRVRTTPDQPDFDIHDRVNYAVQEAALAVDAASKRITLSLTIDAALCPVMDYFEIFLERMNLCRRCAEFLGTTFLLFINGTQML